MQKLKSLSRMILIQGFILTVSLEAILYYAMNFHFAEKFMNPGEYVISNQDVERLKPSFHSTLGWIYPNKTLSGERYIGQVETDSSNREVFLFGDSFVFGFKVKDEESWSARLSHSTKSKVYNYGVPSYGMDQAFLRMEEHASEISNNVVIFGFIGECLARNMNIYPRFRKKRFELTLTKPYWIMSENGPQFMANPIASKDEIKNLTQKDFLAGLHNDFFYPESHSLNHFPRFPVLFNSLFWNQIKSKYPLNHNNQMVNNSLWSRKEAAIALRILKEAKKLAKNKKATIAFMIFPDQGEIKNFHEKNKIPDHILVLREWAKKEKFELIDLFQEFIEVPPNEVSTLYLKNDPHLSAKGNQLVESIVQKRINPYLKKN